jgi:hypothetical protein
MEAFLPLLVVAVHHHLQPQVLCLQVVAAVITKAKLEEAAALAEVVAEVVAEVAQHHLQARDLLAELDRRLQINRPVAVVVQVAQAQQEALMVAMEVLPYLLPLAAQRFITLAAEAAVALVEPEALVVVFLAQHLKKVVVETVLVDLRPLK